MAISADAPVRPIARGYSPNRETVASLEEFGKPYAERPRVPSTLAQAADCDPTLEEDA
jgi:hypothetical protein